MKILFSHGEAPENLLAVENVATGANKPGWVMQSDLIESSSPCNLRSVGYLCYSSDGRKSKNENEQHNPRHGLS